MVFKRLVGRVRCNSLNSFFIIFKLVNMPWIIGLIALSVAVCTISNNVTHGSCQTSEFFETNEEPRNDVRSGDSPRIDRGP